MIDHTTRIPKDSCPACKATLDAVTGFDGRIPEPNDLTVCINCGFILVFDQSLKVRKASKVDLSGLDKDATAKLCMILSAVKQYKVSKN